MELFFVVNSARLAWKYTKYWWSLLTCCLSLGDFFFHILMHFSSLHFLIGRACVNVIASDTVFFFQLPKDSHMSLVRISWGRKPLQWSSRKSNDFLRVLEWLNSFLFSRLLEKESVFVVFLKLQTVLLRIAVFLFASNCNSCFKRWLNRTRA